MGLVLGGVATDKLVLVCGLDVCDGGKSTQSGSEKGQDSSTGQARPGQGRAAPHRTEQSYAQGGGRASAMGGAVAKGSCRSGSLLRSCSRIESNRYLPVGRRYLSTYVYTS
ncbi:hypothetical protein TWF718_001676 [Orbilia javanica]|uniref:Uncharacterized protein n=1 Tax=Orbilia javanica TaxID=47235 RepID=A0AAN8N1P4_9PEZI